MTKQIVSPPSHRFTAPMPLSLYIHWPFCLSKCPYCDFNSYVNRDMDEQRFISALITEMKSAAQRFDHPPHLVSIFFGGGTPSLMPPEGVAHLIDVARTLFSFDDAIEITMEANPTTFERSRFQAFYDAGIRRLSLGVQSFSDDHLAFLGRGHSAAEAKNALAQARDIFPRMSFDLMYGLRDQTGDMWRHELIQAWHFQPTHVSCYQLTFEPGTAFYPRYVRGELTYPEEGIEVAFDEETETFWYQKGVNRYEVSNYARPGEESRHNLAYWRFQPTLGLGPGSHGRPHYKQGRYREVTYRHPQTWLEAVEKHGHGTETSVPLFGDEYYLEKLMMGLRLTEGIKIKAFHDYLSHEKVEILEQHGLVLLTKDALKVTSQGRLCLNSVIRFLTHSAQKERHVFIE